MMNRKTENTNNEIIETKNKSKERIILSTLSNYNMDIIKYSKRGKNLNFFEKSILICERILKV